MPTVKAQTTLPYTTGLPEDVASNTLYFTSVVPYSPADLTQLADAIALGIYATQTAGIGFSNVASTALSRGVDACEIAFYDMDALPPRQPIQIERFTLPFGVTAGDQDLPHECAICVSFRGDFITGVAPARQRGRNYMGPWVASVNANGRPTAAVRTMLQNAFLAMVAAKEPGPFTWVVRSSVTGATFPVTELWVDNAWDTQRRRGVQATARGNVPVAQ